MSGEPPIVVRLDGGLGNQLFQVAFAEWLKLRFQRRIVFDASGLPAIRRSPIDPEIRGDHGLASSHVELRWRSIYWAGGKYNALLLQASQRLGLNRLLSIVKETDDAPAEEMNFTRPPRWAVGFWQSNRFVSEPVLARMDQRLHSLPASRASAVGRNSSEQDGIAVHLRWGDYKYDARNRGRHGLLGMRYYQEALARLGPERPVTVFTDDAGAAAWFISNCGRRNVQHHRGGGVWEDFFALSRLGRVVVANSSFSWWAAAHNGAGKQVAMPAQWFAGEKMNGRAATARLYRPGWIQVENDWL